MLIVLYPHNYLNHTGEQDVKGYDIIAPLGNTTLTPHLNINEAKYLLKMSCFLLSVECWTLKPSGCSAHHFKMCQHSVDQTSFQHIVHYQLLSLNRMVLVAVYRTTVKYL